MIGETKSLHPAFKMAVDRILTAMRARGWDATVGSGPSAKRPPTVLAKNENAASVSLQPPTEPPPQRLPPRAFFAGSIDHAP